MKPLLWSSTRSFPRDSSPLISRTVMTSSGSCPQPMPRSDGSTYSSMSRDSRTVVRSGIRALELWDRMFAVNVRAPFALMQGALKLMERDGIEGAIVNIDLSQRLWWDRFPRRPTAPARARWRRSPRTSRIRCSTTASRSTAINLGWVDTPGEHAVLKRFQDAGDDWLEKAEASRPFGRLIKPDEVARVIAFLASAESGLMTGALIDFDQQVVGATACRGRELTLDGALPAP